MLILIPGITGNLGKHLTHSALIRGHQVRGLGRDHSKLLLDIKNKLENFIETSSYYDIPAIEKAMQGVDALILLRAAEKAGVKRFHASSWNYDWRPLPLSTLESYSPYISFHHHASLTSTTKPIYMFIGVFAEVYISCPGHGDFSPKNHGEWDPERKELSIWGDGEQVLWWTMERDAAEFSVETVTREGAEEGGGFVVCSGLVSLKELAREYGEVRGCDVKIVRKGGVEELERTTIKAREEGDRKKFWEYIGYLYSLLIIQNGKKWEEIDFLKFPDVKRTSLREFLERNPDI